MRQFATDWIANEEAQQVAGADAAQLGHWAAKRRPAQREFCCLGGTMKTFIAYCFGLLGFLLQGGAVIGLPVYVLFFGGSSWWMLAFFPLGFVGMIPLSIMSLMLKNEKGE